ncbi:Uncharacterised protein [BD1-7 clade bacterium]|uniref:DUF1425 domain-containing protein n=1 Tax=BD1-7 clade bacterium TaxID=2029982 RepID=A0A5S9N5W7_9GAMM|nr:Uncharacterised protein [BD1-7 clade bacterium]CAA0084329.1 Uncharacterised protein [BD1-7 clade bacterium]CAA0115593.1 Uncharacterised protein [BD1-7 clade bacterium]
MFPKTLRNGLLLLLTALALVACSSTGSKKAPPAVQVSNPQADRYVSIGNMLHRLKGDIMQFSVEVQNKANNTVKLQYKFKFFDADGFEVASQGRPWAPLVLHAKETTNVQAVAPDMSVKSAKLFIRE